jgi:hypothetical protein
LKNLLECKGGDELITVVSVVKQDNLEAAYDTLRFTAKFKDTENPYRAYGNLTKAAPNADVTIDSLASTCWGRIDRALALGYEALLSRHVKSFSSKMNRVSLQGGSEQDTPSAAATVTPTGLVCAWSLAVSAISHIRSCLILSCLILSYNVTLYHVLSRISSDC